MAGGAAEWGLQTGGELGKGSIIQLGQNLHAVKRLEKRKVIARGTSCTGDVWMQNKLLWTGVASARTCPCDLASLLRVRNPGAARLGGSGWDSLSLPRSSSEVGGGSGHQKAARGGMKAAPQWLIRVAGKWVPAL